MNDKIFLLSKDEYKNYRGRIPTIGVIWWLRTNGKTINTVACVEEDGAIYGSGRSFYAHHEYNGRYYRVAIGVRPAIKISSGFELGDRIIKCGFPWVVIGDCIAIAEVPIAFRPFSNINGSGIYEKSDIRRFLLDWYALREE